MTDPYEPVSVSKSGEHPFDNTASDGEAVGLDFYDRIEDEPIYLIEDSSNAFGWVEATDDDSFVDLADWR